MTAPRWAFLIVADICAEAGVEEPGIHWRRLTPPGVGAGGRCTETHIVVSAWPGTQRRVVVAALLHEMAHWLTRSQWAGRRRAPAHDDRFYRVLYDLGPRYGVSRTFILRHEVTYKAAATLTAMSLGVRIPRDVRAKAAARFSTLGVDMSTRSAVRSSHQAGRTGRHSTRGSSRRKEPDMASKPQTRREAIKSGRAKVATDVAPDIAESESLGPVVNPDGTPTDVTVEMLTGKAPETTVPAGSVFITLTERDRIRAEGGKALIARVNAGILVRPNGKPAAKFTQDDVLPKYYRNFLLAVSLTTAMREDVATVDVDPEWGWSNTGTGERKARSVTVTEAAPAAPALPRRASPGEEQTPTPAQKRYRKAKAIVDAVDALPGPEVIKAIGTREVQDALEVVGGREVDDSASDDDEAE